MRTSVLAEYNPGECVASSKRKRKSTSKKAKKTKRLAPRPKPPRPPKAAKAKKPYSGSTKARTAIYDPQSGRWRAGGKFVSAPTSRQIRRDKAGRPIDARGRRVPASALGSASKKPTKAKPKRPKTIKGPVFAPPTSPPRRARLALVAEPPPVLRLKAGYPVVEKEFLSSTFVNKQSPVNAGEILEKVLERQAKKGPFDAHDIPIYHFGIKLVGEQRLTAEVISEISQDIPPGMQIGISDTRLGTEVYVRLNIDKEPLLLDQASDMLSDRQTSQYLKRLYESLMDWWGDLDWYVWAESDESLYE